MCDACYYYTNTLDVLQWRGNRKAFSVFAGCVKEVARISVTCLDSHTQTCLRDEQVKNESSTIDVCYDLTVHIVYLL